MIIDDLAHMNFVTTDSVEKVGQKERLKIALSKVFPRTPTTNLYLKPLYVTPYIEGFLISKVFVDWEEQ